MGFHFLIINMYEDNAASREVFPELEFSQYAILLPNLSLMGADKLSGFRSNSGHLI